MCFKIRYETGDAAKKELKKARKEYKKWFGHTRRQERRAYFCERCKEWHLTSISKNEWDIIK